MMTTIPVVKIVAIFVLISLTGVGREPGVCASKKTGADNAPIKTNKKISREMFLDVTRRKVFSNDIN